MARHEDLLASLEAAAERAGDINDRIYARYFEICPPSRALMSHIDRYVQGRMLDEVYRLLMMPDVSADHDYLRFETASHRNYGVQPEMYRNLLTAVRDVVKDALQTDWNEPYAAAWEQRSSELLTEIEPLAQSAAVNAG